MVFQASCEVNGTGTSFEFLNERCMCHLLKPRNGYHTDCSSRNLTYIPKFPGKVTEINLSYNHFDTIRASNGSQIPSEVRSLDLSYCEVKEIHRGFLRSFVKLELLDISYNRELTLEVLPNVTHDLQFTSVKTFKLDYLHCGVGGPNILRFRHLCHLRNTSLEDIHFSGNRIEEIERYVLANLPDTLKSLTAADNRFTLGWYFLEISSMKNIIFANLSSQYKSSGRYLTMFQTSCNDGGKMTNTTKDRNPRCEYHESQMTNTRFSPSCLEEYHDKRTHDRITIYVCLPRSLKTLILDHSALRPSDVLNFTFFDFRTVQKYIVKGNLAEYLKGEIISSNLTYADYSNNFISSIYPMYFHDANLTHLDLSDNYMGDQIENENINFLKDQTFLRYLSLARNRISRIPSTLFDRLQHLKHLDLSENSLQAVSFNLNKLKSLHFLNLRSNRINFLTHENMRQLQGQRSNTLVFDLSKNVILCSCETLQFLKWIQDHAKSGILRFKEYKNYTCSFTNSTRKDFSQLSNIINEMGKKCPSYIGLIVGIMVTITAFLVSMAAGITYRMRWRLRYLYYMAKRAYKRNAM